MMTKRNKRILIGVGIIAVAAILIVLNNLVANNPKRIQKDLERKYAQLENYIGKALEQDPSSWMHFDRLPKDIVLYKYVGDTLQSWQKQFTTESDELAMPPSGPGNDFSRRNIFSALSFVGERPVFMRLGFKNYILCSGTRGAVRVIGGVELRPNDKYDISPLSSDMGSVVSLGGYPQFRIRHRTDGVRNPITDELSQIKSILIVCALFFIVSLAAYYNRNRFSGKKTGIRMVVVALVVLILLFLFVSVLKITVYTHISLALYHISTLTMSSLVVYVAFLMALLSVVLLLGCLGADVFSRKGRIVLPVVLGSFLMSIVLVMTFTKEKQLSAAWAEGIAIERDIRLEDALRTFEDQIARDDFIPMLALTDNPELEIRRHIGDVYFRRLPLEYQLSVKIGGDINGLGMDRAVRISPDSRFVHAPLLDIPTRYVGSFRYFLPFEGLTTIFITIEQKPEIRNRVFPNVFGGRVASEIPQKYSFAKYSGADRQLSFGSYSYPIELNQERMSKFYSSDNLYFREGSYIHFVTKVGPDEIVVISRPSVPRLSVVILIILVQLVLFFLMSLFVIRKTTSELSSRNYYRRNIFLVLMLSQVVTMAILASVSVAFVYERSETNLKMMMSDKLNSIRYMLQSGIRTCQSAEDLYKRETSILLGTVSENTSSDINLYSVDGNLITSTAPGGKIRAMFGGRMDEEAYEQIFYSHKGNFIQKENDGQRRRYYTMYAPLFNSNGDMIAVFSSPYTEKYYSLGEDAIMHSVSIVTVFLILLLLSLALTERIVDRMFRPLSEMSSKMASADLDSLEYIQYDRQDEITGLVASYNRMVNELSESTKALAQAERDKAWSAMARQVAHEIKNPLTPMKLQIQRICRLKSQQDPSWQEKFDEMAGVILEHIDLLTETANEFSTFAKLYTEEPVTFSFSRMIKDEMALFGSVDGLEIVYNGPESLDITGPKPQLTRVVFNLLNNAVQACSGHKGGKVGISAVQEDAGIKVTVEDNGPGVDKENIEKLFTPNFTTKTGGTGLGLAISRSVLESCGATIAYSVSESLGGACFTIKFPR